MTTSSYKLRLQRNYTAVIKDLEPEKVLDYLFQDGIFDWDDMDDVKSEKTRKKRAVTLMDKVFRSGSHSLESFVNALSKTQSHLYDLLQQPFADENQLEQEEENLIVGNFSGLHVETPPSTFQKGAATPVEQGHLPPELGKTDKGSAICVTEDDHNFVNPTDLSRVPAHNHPGSDGVYKMSAKPRGVALIINNEEFTPESELTKKELEMRYGSRKDVEKLEELFEALDFKVQTHENKTKGEIIKLLDDAASDKELGNYDCFVLWLMSHGENGLLYCTDGKTLHIETVRDMFNNANCLSLRSKPKLFFIQACRGKLRDSGVVADSPVSSIHRLPSTGDDTSINQGENSDVGWKFNLSDSIPGHADILVAHSTVGGFASFRNTEKGSRFVRCLVEVFREYAGYEDLVSMLTIVNDRVSKMGELGSKQVSQPEHTLRKKLFFWPGLDLQSRDLC